MGKLISKAIFKGGSDKISVEVPKSFFDLKAKDIDGNIVDFHKFEDRKVIMVVNVACKWGLTSPNYKEMVKIHNELKSRGFEILAFPSNEFFNQESGSEGEIKKFVKDNFNANFPIFAKSEVNGANPNPVFGYLRRHSSLYDKETGEAKVIPWNFAKFIVNRKG